MEVKERGAASINITLTGGVITVTHGEDGTTLERWTANEGDWQKLWACIEAMKALA